VVIKKSKYYWLFISSRKIEPEATLVTLSLQNGKLDDGLLASQFLSL
jgi:hypothetical protein